MYTVGFLRLRSHLEIADRLELTALTHSDQAGYIVVVQAESRYPPNKPTMTSHTKNLFLAKLSIVVGLGPLTLQSTRDNEDEMITVG